MRQGVFLLIENNRVLSFLFYVICVKMKEVIDIIGNGIGFVRGEDCVLWSVDVVEG